MSGPLTHGAQVLEMTAELQDALARMNAAEEKRKALLHDFKAIDKECIDSFHDYRKAEEALVRVAAGKAS